MSKRGLAVPHVVALGASAGGIGALCGLLAHLPPALPAAILIVQHLAPDFVSRLPELLSIKSGHPVSGGRDGELIEAGRAYIAPTNRHMTVDADGCIRLHETARIHFSRPSVDVLFCSLAPVFRNRVIAVVLTGGGVDGTEGARIIRQHGGVVIVQSEATSEHFGMPGSVIHGGHADYVLPLSQIPQRIVELAAITHG